MENWSLKFGKTEVKGNTDNEILVCFWEVGEWVLESLVAGDSREKEGEGLGVVNTGNSLAGLCYKKSRELGWRLTPMEESRKGFCFVL